MNNLGLAQKVESALNFCVMEVPDKEMRMLPAHPGTSYHWSWIHINIFCISIL